MIIFTPIRDIPVELLEAKRIRQVVKYNLSSYYSDVPTLNMLIPSSEYIPEELMEGDCSLPVFDIEYHKFIFENNEAFMQFMNLIIPVFGSPEVLVQILINQSEFRDIITESLIKLIQQRYGYNAYIVNEVDDFLYTEESSMSIPGLFIMDQDLHRWRSLMPVQEYDMYE